MRLQEIPKSCVNPYVKKSEVRSRCVSGLQDNLSVIPDNPDTQEKAARELSQQGYTRLPGFLEPEFAERLRRCLLDEVPWTLACRTEEGSQTIPNDRYTSMGEYAAETLYSSIQAAASTDFGFAYESYMMVPAYLEKRDPGLLLHQLLEFLNHPQTLARLAAVTGDSTVARLDAQATCYRSGHFLRYHNDLAEGESRRFAFVLNLSQNWQADWGGLLQILDGRHEVVATLMPAYNSLTLFRVPLEHCVSMVTPFATEPRLAITGWLRQ